MGTGDGNEGAQAKLKWLRRRIERWRWTRTKRTSMPAELWTAATELARELGACRAARELGIGYQSLRERLGNEGCAERQPTQAFVEVDTSSLFTAPPAMRRGEVELSDANGAKMVIRLGASESVDVAALVAAFRATAR